MRHAHRFAALAMLALTASPSVSGPAIAQTAGPRYTLTLLAPLDPTYPLGGVGGINRAGHVTGYSYPPSGYFKAALWANGTVANLGSLVLPDDFNPPESSTSLGNGINDLDQVAGKFRYQYSDRPAVFHNGTVTDLGGLPGLPQGQALSINNAGQVVGFVDRSFPGDGDQAFLWQNGTMTNLGTLGGKLSRAFYINNAGQIVGQAALAGTAGTHAFLWQNGVMKDLGVLGSGQFSVAFSANDLGQVVGLSTTVPGSLAPRHAFLYSSGKMTDLGLPGTNTEMFATAINSSGVIVGNNDSPLAFIWRNGVWTDLNTLIPQPATEILASATGINDAGQIVGMTRNQIPYILTPVH